MIGSNSKEPFRIKRANQIKEGEVMDIKWAEGYKIKVNGNDSQIVISANKEGLLSLAAQLVSLAEAAPGSHIHYDECNSLEDGSTQLIVERLS